jgi:DNA-binding response OmpR family regulator
MKSAAQFLHPTQRESTMASLNPISPSTPTRELPPGRVLLADDDEDLRILMALHLRKSGYTVVEFQDGEGVLEYIGTLLMRGPEMIRASDMVVLDIKMPGFSGLQILASLRLAGWRNPIVLMTALQRAVENDALKLGATALFHKPFDPRQVLDLLARVRKGEFGPSPQPLSPEMQHLLRQLCL